MKRRRLVWSVFGMATAGSALAWAMAGGLGGLSSSAAVPVVTAPASPATRHVVGASASPAQPNPDAAVPLVAPGPPAGYTLAYQDEFDGSSLNRADWYYRITDGKYQLGYMRQANVSVSGGILRLRYDREAVPGVSGLQLTGGGIISRARFGYGYYETQARLFEATEGAHTSFWTLGLNGDDANSADPEIRNDINAGKLPGRGNFTEIDGFEHQSEYGLDMGTSKQSEQTTNCRVGFRTGAQNGGISYSNWNTYGFEYTPTSFTFYLNGQPVKSYALSTCPMPYGPMNFWLTLLPYFQQPTNLGAFPGYSDFAYFRYYKRNNLNTNLLGNGSFDVDSVQPAPAWYPLGWQESGDAPASQIITTDKYNGTKALAHTSTSAYLVTTKQDLRYIPNGTYRLTAFVKSSGGQNQALMRVVDYGGAERNVAIPQTSTWTQITIDNITVTSGKATIAFTSDSPANKWIHVDNVVLVQKS